MTSLEQVAETGGPTPRALKAMGLTVLAMLATAGASYVVPSLERVRPWVAGEGVPVVRMFMGREAAVLPSFAEAGMLAKGVQQSGPDDDLAAQLATAPAPTLPVDPAGGGAQPGGPTLRIDPAEFAELPRSIEYAEQLAPFFAELRKSAMKQPGAVTRVAHYGDSAVAADAITHTARRLLQRRFGDSGHGFILVSRGNMHYGHRDVRLKASEGWESFSIVRNQLGKGWYGYGGIQYRARAGQHSYLATTKDGPVGRSVGSFELFFQRYRGGGKLRLKLDGKRHSTISTRGADKEDAWERISVSDGPHSLSIQVTGGGAVRLYGVAMERDAPGVVYDSLGLVGARAQRLLNATPEHMARQIAHRSPDLLVLGFGGNEAGNSWLDLGRYERELTQVVRSMRKGKPEMACLLFGPLDQGYRNKRGQVATIPKLPEIVEVQRRVAKAERCAFFDVFAAMGGEGAVRTWFRRRPKLISSDLRHATPKGYELIGTLYYKALLESFDRYLAKPH